MDNDDREEIQKHFELLEQNNRNIIQNLNDQVSINKQISDQMENITKHINVVQDKITNKIMEFQNHVHKIDQELQFFIITTEINENINILSKQISNIKEIILASKLEILPRDIFTEEEVRDSNITIEMLSYIKNCVLFQESVVVFVLSIPNFVKTLYFRAHLEKVPNKNSSLEISTGIDKVIISKQTVFKNVDKIHILKRELVPYQDKCIANLINNKDMRCNYQTNNREEIKVISDNVVVTKNLKETLLANNCGEQLGIKIKGNNIIKFRNCRISIGNLQYKNSEAEYYGKILPNVERNITVEEVINKFDLQSLHFQHINNTNHLEKIRSSNTQRWQANLTINFIMAASVLIIILYLFTQYRRRQMKVKIQLKRHRQEPSLEEGGVTSPQEIPSPFL